MATIFFSCSFSFEITCSFSCGNTCAITLSIPSLSPTALAVLSLSPGDETITQSNSFTNEPTQTANEECNGEGVTCTITQESESNGGGPVTHGPITTSRSNLKPLSIN
jgi:hypothetical protein